MDDIQLLALKNDFTIHSILQPVNTQWSRKYYEPGTFSLQLPLAQYSNRIAYIYTKDRPEVGIVLQTNYNEDNHGFKYVQLSGLFMENELNDEIVYPLFVGKGNVEDEITRMVNTYKGGIQNLVVAASSHQGTATDFQEGEKELGAKAYEILKLHEMSYSIVYDFLNSKKKFAIWQGKDRTQSQKANNFIVFSSDFGNLKNPNVYQSSTDYKNYAVIKGKVDETEIFVTCDLSQGKHKRKIFLDGGSVQFDRDNMTIDEYKEALQQYGRIRLLEDYCKTLVVECDVLEGSYVYMSDFDIGDKCDIIVSEMGLQVEARIICIYEVIKSGNHTITLKFGNQEIVEYAAE